MVLYEKVTQEIQIIKQATGSDKIPPKIVELSVNVFDSYFTNIIHKDTGIVFLKMLKFYW